MLPATALGCTSVALLRGNTAASRGVAGFGAAVLAAPGLLSAGIPLATGSQRLMLGIGGSVVLWFLLGIVAARRATRSPVATWRNFWSEYLWLAAGVWLGVAMSLLIVRVAIGSGVL